ncbi:MAG: phosphoenolpyruvate hydrolase family protein [Actinobacteria bacterium]|nr:phosphoenolpyruvate hydrolase family protein [Actinomycetota bacterium]
MNKKFTREEVIEKLKKTINTKKAILLASAGDGFTAKLLEKGGIDLIGIYNTGVYRHYGIGSLAGLLPIGRNNQMVLDYAPSVIQRVKETPLVAGFCAQDPATLWELLFEKIEKMGIIGIQNFPTVGLIDADSVYRQNLEESDLGFNHEVEMLKLAHEMGLFTVGYCFTPDEVKKIAKAGVDIVAVHCGCTTGGLTGVKTVMSIEDAIKATNDFIRIAREVRPAGDFIVITHGGPMDNVENTQKVLAGTEAVGYTCGSSIERTAVEPVLIKATQEFKSMTVNVPDWLNV